jgi:hypothetical protein
LTAGVGIKRHRSQSRDVDRREDSKFCSIARTTDMFRGGHYRSETLTGSTLKIETRMGEL